MSSPKITRMFGFFAWAWAAGTMPSVSASARPPIARVRFVTGSPSSLARRREDRLPVVLHADHGPVLLDRLVPGLVQPADLRLPVVCPLALGVVVVHEAH